MAQPAFADEAVDGADAQGVVGGVVAHDQRRLPRRPLGLLEDGDQGRDARTGADHEQVSAAAFVGGHRAVGPLDEHPRTGAQSREAVSAVADEAGRDHELAVGGVGGEREGVSARPARAVEEAPHEELSAAGPQRVDPASGHPHRDAAAAVAFDGADADAVAQRPRQRKPEPEDDDRRHGDAPHRPPVRGRGGRDGEVGTRPQHVRDRESDAEVAVQVQQVPGLVPQAPAGFAHRGHHDEQQQTRARGRQQHARVVPHELPRLFERVDARLHRVAEDLQPDVGREERERPEADDPVHAGDAVAPEAAFEQRHARHQQHLVEEQVGGCQARGATEGVERVRSPGRQRLHLSARDPHGHDDEARRPDDDDRGEVPRGPALRALPLRAARGNGGGRSGEGGGCGHALSVPGRSPDGSKNGALGGDA